MAGRKPLGPALVEHLDGSTSAKERLELILQTLAGQVTVVGACQLLDISEAMFYKLRNRVLQVCLEDLEPKPRGRPPQLSTADAGALGGVGSGGRDARARIGGADRAAGVGAAAAAAGASSRGQ